MTPTYPTFGAILVVSPKIGRDDQFDHSDFADLPSIADDEHRPANRTAV
jgi:hypothetical protein